MDGRSVDRALIEKMNATMVHRGPDDDGYHIDGTIGLGHRRLSIIDLHTGRQPIYNEDNTKVVIFNGEIYNFHKLRADLEGRGHRFKTNTDTEVILHGYEEWGTNCVHRLRGMFSFAVWDQIDQTLFLARDRLGIKPLYYYSDDKCFIFASELKAIIEAPFVSKDLSYEAISDYVSFGYIPSPKTIFRSIQKLPAGHFLVKNKQKTILKQYWDLKFQPEFGISERTFCRRILETLEEAIKMRLISDVPLGSFLSGGIDSSLVVAIMSTLMNKPVITNSIGFTLQNFSELKYAKTISRMFNTNHHEFEVSPDAVDIVNTLSWYFDEPFADSSSIPTYYVSRMTRQNVTVALSGDGGDENFAGYRRYFFDRLENKIRSILPENFRYHVFGPVSRVYPKADWLPQIFRGKVFLTNVANDDVFGYYNSMSHFLPDMKECLFTRDLKEKLYDYSSMEVFRNHYNNCNSTDPLTRSQYVDFKTYLVDDILTKVDRASMANSLEVRVPLLDHKFVELVSSIPSDIKLKRRQSKYIFKKAAAAYIPNKILHRQKMGFSIPVGQWLKKELKPLVHDTILSEKFKERALFDFKYVHRLWEHHCKGVSDNTQPLWVLLCFELWARRFL